MASPMIESRIEPHKKAHFSLQISDRIAHSDEAQGDFSSVKYNHKPTQTLDSRSTTLTSPSSSGLYNLRIDDTNDSGDKDVFTFTGQKSQLKKSYVLVLDPSSQQATLEPLSSSYTFNLATKNGKDVSSQHAKIYPKKLKDDAHNKDEEDDLFGEAAGVDNNGGDPDPDNPYDFRHFLSKEKEKRGGDESDYKYASSPDYRTGTGSAVNTPQFGARTSATSVAPARKPVTAPAPKKRKPAATNPMVKAKKTQPTPSVRLQRTATDPKPKAKGKAAEPAASKIKSAEIIHS
ncbi:ell-associated factor protein, partial [Pyrenophora tritici-repentis]